MSNDYFDAAVLSISNGTRGDAPDINNVSQAVETAFGLLPTPTKIEEGRVNFYTQTGSANVYTVTTGLSLASYTTGLQIWFKVVNANTTSSTLNVDGLGAVALTYSDGTALASGALVVGDIVGAIYDGSKFQLQKYFPSSAANAAAAAASAAAAAASEAAAAASAASLVSNYAGVSQIGSDTNFAAGGPFALTCIRRNGYALTIALIYFGGVNSSLRTYDFNTLTGAWEAVGNALDLGISVDAPCTATTLVYYDDTPGFEVDPVIAIVDSNTNTLRTYTFDGTDWSLVGSALTIATMGDPTISAISETDVAFVDSTNDSLRTYRWNGSAWSLVGSGLSVSGLIAPTLTTLNTTDVALLDSSSDGILRTYRWNGATWSVVGNSYSTYLNTATTLTMTALNSEDVVVTVNSSFGLPFYIYRWDGLDWLIKFRMGGSGTTSYPVICAMNGSDVAYVDFDTNDLRMYRFTQYSGSGPYTQ